MRLARHWMRSLSAGSSPPAGTQTRPIFFWYAWSHLTLDVAIGAAGSGRFSNESSHTGNATWRWLPPP